MAEVAPRTKELYLKEGARTFLILITALASLNLVWIIVTLITDYKAAFYRKATSYRKQVARQRAEQKSKELRDGSVTSHSQSLLLK